MIKGRKILVTGSSDGIGRSISNFLLDYGASVVGIARNHKKFKNGFFEGATCGTLKPKRVIGAVLLGQKIAQTIKVE